MGQTLSLSGLWPALVSLILASAVVMGSPGPSTLSVTAIGASFGFRRAFPYAAGLILGTGVVLLAVAAGLVSVLMAQPRLAPILLGLSAAYMAYLAYRIATAPPLSQAATEGRAPRFLGGFLLAIANPKAYLAIGAVYAQAKLVPADALSDAVLKCLILSLAIIAIHALWALAGSALTGALRDPKASRLINLALAASLVVVLLIDLV